MIFSSSRLVPVNLLNQSHSIIFLIKNNKTVTATLCKKKTALRRTSRHVAAACSSRAQWQTSRSSIPTQGQYHSDVSSSFSVYHPPDSLSSHVALCSQEPPLTKEQHKAGRSGGDVLTTCELVDQCEFKGFLPIKLSRHLT